MMIVLSNPALAIRLSSGDTATDLTQSLCPSNGLPTISPFSTSQIRRVLSSEPLTTRRPSLKNATAHTDLLCPRIVCVGAGCVVCTDVRRLPIRDILLATSRTPDMSCCWSTQGDRRFCKFLAHQPTHVGCFYGLFHPTLRSHFAFSIITAPAQKRPPYITNLFILFIVKPLLGV
ncbi:hypothetical protein EDB19DRAFT_1728363 [Suillus lakei]|nr:hypothetical protein EDB19DRAFT_1728363 [Suillus lakei]